MGRSGKTKKLSQTGAASRSSAKKSSEDRVLAKLIEKEANLGRIDKETLKGRSELFKRFLSAQSAEGSQARRNKVRQIAKEKCQGRGWLNKDICVFVLDKEETEKAEETPIKDEEWARIHGRSLGSAAVFVAFHKDLTDEEMARVGIHEMVHSREHALKKKESDRKKLSTKEDFTDYLLQEAITEVIAEEIMPQSQRIKDRYPIITAIQKVFGDILKQENISIKEIEGLTNDEVIDMVSSKLQLSQKDFFEYFFNKANEILLKKGEKSLESYL